MARVSLVIAFILGFSTCLNLALSVPLEDVVVDGDTVILDETTTVGYGVVAATEADASQKNDDVQPPPVEETAVVDECKTIRGFKGQCVTIKDCYPVLVPVDSTPGSGSTNMELAQMLVNVSGFCAGGLNARSDITPGVFEQVMRSEVLLCCPADPENSKKKVILDQPSEDAYAAKSCGYLKVDKSTLPLTNGSRTVELDEEGRILKGRKAGVGEFPWMVAMMNRGRQFCGGSLINERTILTAAHCVQHMTAADVKSLRLQIGDHDIYKKTEAKHEERGASKVLFHKGFSMKHLMHDIALVHLDRPVSFTSNIQPVCLHTGTPTVDNGKVNADVTGWGALTEGGGQPADLRTVRVRVLTKEQCLQKYKNSANMVQDGMVCAGADNGEDSCQGDSGGPLTVESRAQAKQIGVVSWGIGCGRYPGVYTFVYKYISWVNKNKAV